MGNVQRKTQADQRKRSRRDIWYNLDNAANIFPAISDERNTNVFRLSCELKETIHLPTLQQATELAMKHFDYFQMVLRRGLFWFYLEQTDLIPQVAVESERPVGRLFYVNRKELLFSVTCYLRRINLEVFHAVSDGTGAMQLLREIVYHYLTLSHREELPDALPPLDNQSPPVSRAEDGFSRHYNPEQKRSPFREKVYTIAGSSLPGNSISIIRGQVSTKAILALAKSKGVSVTAYLAALMLCAVYHELMPARARKKPIGINIPVDLRNHFPSETARNFFSVVEVTYNFQGQAADFDAALKSVAEQLAEKLQPDALAGRMNYTMSVQRNVFARAAPLILKNLVLRAAYHQGERATTCALSNVGRVTMPEPFGEYIENFSALLNPTPIHRLKATLVSYGDHFLITFTSSIAETRAQKYCFRSLAQNGVDVLITSNGVDDDEIL